MAKIETFEVITLVDGKKGLKQTITETKEETQSVIFTFDNLQRDKAQADAKTVDLQRLIDQAVLLGVDKP